MVKLLLLDVIIEIKNQSKAGVFQRTKLIEMSSDNQEKERTYRHNQLHKVEGHIELIELEEDVFLNKSNSKIIL